MKFTEEYLTTMTGPVTTVCVGTIADEIFTKNLLTTGKNAASD